MPGNHFLNVAHHHRIPIIFSSTPEFRCLSCLSSKVWAMGKKQVTKYMYIYIYLEPVCPLFWWSNQNKGHLGSRYIMSINKKYGEIEMVMAKSTSWSCNSWKARNDCPHRMGRKYKTCSCHMILDPWHFGTFCPDLISASQCQR